MKRRIVKETALFGVKSNAEWTRPRDRFVVERQNYLGEWETETIPLAEGWEEGIPAIFRTYEEATSYVNGEYGNIGREVMWEGEA